MISQKQGNQLILLYFILPRTFIDCYFTLLSNLPATMVGIDHAPTSEITQASTETHRIAPPISVRVAKCTSIPAVPIGSTSSSASLMVSGSCAHDRYTNYYIIYSQRRKTP